MSKIKIFAVFALYFSWVILFAAPIPKDEGAYKTFDAFQRVSMPLSQKSTVSLTDSKKAKYIDIEIKNAPPKIEELISAGIKKGEVIENIAARRAGDIVMVRIFVRSENFSYFYGLDPKSGQFVLDIGQKREAPVSDEKHDINLSKIYIDMFMIEDKVKVSLLAHTYNFYFIAGNKLPFISPPMDLNAEYPFLQGTDKDIRIYNSAAEAFNKKEFEKAEKILNSLYSDFKKTPVFSISDFMKYDIERSKLKKEKDVPNYKWMELYHLYRIGAATYPKSYMAAWGYVMMGEIAYRLKMFPEGARDFKVVVDRYGTSEYRNIATIRSAEYLLYQKRFAEALKLLATIGEPNNDYEKATIGTLLGLAYIFNGNEEAGVKLFEDVINKPIGTLHDAVLMTSAEILLINRKTDAARKFYEAILKNYPSSKFVSVANFRMGDTYLIEGNIKKALEQYQKTLNSFRDYEGGRLSRLQISEIEFFTRKEEPDLEMYLRSLKSAETDFELSVLFFKLAMKFYRMGEIENSVNMLAILIEKWPMSLASTIAKNVSYSILSHAVKDLYAKEKFASVVNIFQMIPDFMTKAPDIADIMILLGKSFSRLTLYDSAAKVFNEVLRTQQGEEAFLKSVAILNLLDNYIQDGDRLRARMTIEYYNDFMAFMKELYPVFLRLKGDFFMKIEKNPDKAVELYKESLKIEPYDINKLILASRISEIYYAKNDYEEAANYAYPVFDQFKEFYKTYDFFEYTTAQYLMSLVLNKKNEKFFSDYRVVAPYLTPEIKEGFDLLSAFMLIEENKLTKAGEILKGKFTTLKPLAETAKSLITNRQNTIKKEEELFAVFKDYMNKIKWYKDKK